MHELNNEEQERFTDLQARNKQEVRRYFGRKPKTAKALMAKVMSQRGYGRIISAEHFNKALKESLGDPLGKFVQVARLHRGRLEVIVSNSTVLQELTYHKERILEEVSKALPDESIQEIRFRVGVVEL